MWSEIQKNTIAKLKADLEWCLWVLGVLKARQKPETTTSTTSRFWKIEENPIRAVLNPQVPYDWSTPTAARHSCRVIADEEKLTVAQKNLMSQVIHCESGYNNKATHPNLNTHGLVTSTHFGIAQINDHYHIGQGKTFPSVEYVMENPEAVIRWMCKMVKTGKINLWICFTAGMYKNYSA